MLKGKKVSGKILNGEVYHRARKDTGLLTVPVQNAGGVVIEAIKSYRKQNRMEKEVDIW